MPSKFKNPDFYLDRILEYPAWAVSGAIHFSVFAVAVVMFNFSYHPSIDMVNMDIFENPVVSSRIAPIAASKVEPKPKSKEKAVFGAHRKSLTDDSGLDVKAGNTVAKAVDQETLKDSDAASLPIPVEDYLVGSMPVLEREVRILYPPAAKHARVQGAVLMDILIDRSGAVREARLLEGPGYGLNEAALEAVKQFRFKPAAANGQSVAVRIRYSYRFVLER